jgi:hypothetical protein
MTVGAKLEAIPVKRSPVQQLLDEMAREIDRRDRRDRAIDRACLVLLVVAFVWWVTH